MLGHTMIEQEVLKAGGASREGAEGIDTPGSQKRETRRRRI